MGSHEVVDLALSDDDGDTTMALKLPEASYRDKQEITSREAQSTAVVARGEIDLTDDLIQIGPPPTRRTSSLVRSVSKPNAGPILPETVPTSDVHSRVTGAVLGTGAAAQGATARRGRLSRCESCFKDDVPRMETFCLETCGHRLCPACVAAHVCVHPSSSSPPSFSSPIEGSAGGRTGSATSSRSSGGAHDSQTAPLCPVADCTTTVSVRDLALVLQEEGWSHLQATCLASFRARSHRGIRCPGCSGWVEPSSAADAGSSVVVVQGRGGGNSSRSGRRASNGKIAVTTQGTARRRAEDLLSAPAVVCGTCGIRMCRFCGSRLRTPNTAHSPPCGYSKLRSASGLLTLVEELLANPADVTLTGPAGPIKPSPAGSVRGRGWEYGRGRGRLQGRGRGGYALGVGAGYGPAAKGISSKWSKGTGYGGAGNEAASMRAQALAQEAEGRADRAMVAVLDAFTSCLPADSEFPSYLPELVGLIKESSLLQAVCAYLRNDSLMDIAQRSDLYEVNLWCWVLYAPADKNTCQYHLACIPKQQ